MKRSGHQLGWIFAGCVMILCGQAKAGLGVDSFLTLSSPTLVSNTVEFRLTGEADISYVVEASTNLLDWAPATTNTSAEISWVISLETNAEQSFYRAWREPLPMFAGALVVRSNITLQSSFITIDSYDSGDPNHSDSSGRYDPLKRKAGGDVFSAFGLINAGNAEIKGKLYTSPTNAGYYSLGPNGSVGDLSWMGPGIQPGWYDEYFRWALPDVAAPYSSGLPPSNEGTTNYWFLGNAEYFFNGNISGKSTNTISVIGHATIYVTGNFSFPGTIVIQPGANLKLYVGGAQTTFGRIANSGTAFSFQYYGLPANTNVLWSGDNEFVGTIYAPQAAVRFSGGGLNPFHFSGACVATSVLINGSVNVHFDENLKRRGPMR